MMDYVYEYKIQDECLQFTHQKSQSFAFQLYKDHQFFPLLPVLSPMLTLLAHILPSACSPLWDIFCHQTPLIVSLSSEYCFISVNIQMSALKILQVLPLLLALLLSLAHRCHSQIQTVFQVIEVPIPSNNYLINLQSGDILDIAMSWSSSVDIDIKVYQSGPNLVLVHTANSPAFFIQQTQYTATSTDSYYIKTYCYTACMYEQFQMTVKVNGVQLYTLYDAVDQNVSIAVKHLVFENACRAKIDFNPGISATISYHSASYTINQISSFFKITVASPGKIKLQLNHFQQTITNLRKVTVTIYTYSDSKCLTFCQVKPYTSGKGIIGSNICNCLPGYAWNSGLLRCQLDCHAIQYAGSNSGINSCLCPSKFVWDSLQLKCVVDCSSIPHALTLVSGTVDQCTCAVESTPNPGTVYFWVLSTLQCVFQVDCTPPAVKYATGAVPSTFDQCTCATGFVFDMVKYQCVRDCIIVSGIATPPKLKPGTIDQCICVPTMFYQLSSGLCQMCPSSCLTCIPYTYPPPLTTLPTSQCTQCADSTFQLYSRPFPTICREKCGDNITLSTPPLPCDNPKFIPYDGCNDYCEVQTDFDCTVTSGVTRCSFNGTLNIEFVSFTREASDNSVQLKLKISPPLYVLSISAQAQLKNIFAISPEKVSISSITFSSSSSSSSSSGLLSISGQLTSDILKSQQLSFMFNPSFSAYLSDHYFSTASQTFTLPSSSIQLPMYMYSDTSFVFVRLIPIVCYMLVVLGWIGFVLGVLMRRLAGLQAMFVLQFSWLPMLWVDAYLLLPLHGLAYMKYSGGYNYQIISQTYAQSTSPSSSSSSSSYYPHITQFKLSKQYLINNYTFLIIFIVVPVLMYLLAAIRLRRHIMAYPDISIDAIQAQIQMNKHNDITINNTINNTINTTMNSTQTEIEITPEIHQLLAVNKQYEYSLQFLMQGAMLNLVYYTSMSCLFIKQSTRTNISSLVVLSLAGAAIVLVLVKLYRDPCPFDYFRTSFRVNLIAVNHYYIHIAVLTISVVLLTAVPKYAVSALVLCLAMCIFTFIFKPYRLVRENYRSAFNYFTICAIIGLKVYMEYVPQAMFNTMATYIYVMAVMCLLLPAVVVLGLVSTIYYWFYYKYIKPKEDEELRKNKQFSDDKKRRKFLNQLNIVSVRDRIKKIKQQTVFKELVPPSINLMDYSNYIKDQELLRQEEKMIRELSSTRPICVDNTQKHRHQKQKKIRDELKIQRKKRKQLNVDVNAGRDSREKLNKQDDTPKILKAPKVVNGEIVDSDNGQEEVSSNYTTRRIAEEIMENENKFINYKGSVEYTHRRMKERNSEWNDAFKEAYDQIHEI